MINILENYIVASPRIWLMSPLCYRSLECFDCVELFCHALLIFYWFLSNICWVVGIICVLLRHCFLFTFCLLHYRRLECEGYRDGVTLCFDFRGEVPNLGIITGEGKKLSEISWGWKGLYFVGIIGARDDSSEVLKILRENQWPAKCVINVT